MKFLKSVFNGMLGVLKFIMMVIVVLLFTMAFYGIVTLVQYTIFAKGEFMIWTVHKSSTKLVFAFEIIFGCILVEKLYLKDLKIEIAKRFFKRYKLTIIATFIVIMYFLVFNVSVFYNNKIVNYSFFAPQGKEYIFTDVKSIDTGVYGFKKLFGHSKGEFYYIIQFNDGTKIDLNLDGGTKEDKDPYQVKEEIDKTLVNLRIPKKADSKYFYLYAEHLDKKYSDRIKNILYNVK